MEIGFYKKDRRNSEAGFSVIETLIAMAILAVVSYGFMGWVDMSYKNLNNANENNEIASSMTRLKAALGDDDTACTAMLRNRSFNSSIPYISYYNSSSASSGSAGVYPPGDYDHHVLDTAAAAGLNGNQNIHVTSIKLEPFEKLGSYYDDPDKPGKVTKPGPDVYVANIVVQFSKTDSSGKSNANGPDIFRKLPIYVLYGPAPATLVKCSPQGINEASMAKFACNLSTDGYSYMDVDYTVNPPVFRCVKYPSLQWFQGTAQAAACPGGTKMAGAPATPGFATNAAKFTCKIGTPQGSIQAQPRTYANGYTDTSATSPVLSNLTATGCTFDYPVGTTSYAGYVGSILCDTKP